MFKSIIVASSALFLLISGASASVGPCERLSEAFVALAKNKDMGLSIENQLDMMERGSHPDTDSYVLGILNIIYSMPNASASEIKSEFLKVCTVNEKGKIELPKNWNPWFHSR